MARLVIAVLLALSSIACAEATPAEAPGGKKSVSTASPSSTEPTDCPAHGCAIPDCGGGTVVNAQFDHVAGAKGVEDAEADAEEWLRAIGGTGDVAGGLPTPQGTIAFLATDDGSDVALFTYESDGEGGWLRSSYAACQSELDA
jgi:hypothetical protein